MDLHHERRGSGPPLLLVHGLGGSRRSFDTIAGDLAAERELVAIDLPGHGESPALPGAPTVAALADAIAAFLREQDMTGIDAVGSSLGARLVLELARRNDVGSTVALDPGGFWNDRERKVFGASVAGSVRLVRALQPVMPALTANPVARTALFAQLSARPWALHDDALLTEMRSFATAPGFDGTLRELVDGPPQEGAPAGATPPILIVWGRNDLVTLARQAPRAARRFPGARLELLERCGHFPHWDRPEETVRLILGATGAQRAATQPAGKAPAGTAPG
jgi:pimeloyl-ACP methyl ester carboxylesterase